MPRVSIPITQIVASGTTPPAVTPGDSGNDHQLDLNDGHVFIEAANTGGGAQTITIVTPNTVDDDGGATGLAINDFSVSVSAGTTQLIGPFPPELVNQSTGFVAIDITVATWNFRAYRL